MGVELDSVLNYVSLVEIDETDPIHTNQYSIEFLSMHFKSWRPFENIVSAHVSSRPA